MLKNNLCYIFYMPSNYVQLRRQKSTQMRKIDACSFTYRYLDMYTRQSVLRYLQQKEQNLVSKH